MYRALADDTLLRSLITTQLASRIVSRDSSVFAGPEATEAHASIRSHLGWLSAPTDMTVHVAELEKFVASVHSEGLADVYLLGMGGSSLCAEVLRDVPLTRSARTRLVVLDTTDERTIRSITEDLVATRALFLVASKSGSTLEVTSLERHFWSMMAARSPSTVGRHFVAITDPGTPLARHATNSGYRQTFVNPPDIGGRYSALSLFGLIPAALLGIDIRALLAAGQQMAERCRVDEPSNPGLALGAFIGMQATAGRDKLTLLVPPSLAPLGVWVEQLVAESTGKQGHGVLPVIGEPIGTPADYGPDRAFVAILAPDAGEVRTAAHALERAGHPVFRIETSASELGAEFYRWEFATAVTGAVLWVNPFDEPNVRDATTRTQAQLDARKGTGTFRLVPPFTPGPGYSRREYRPEALNAAANPSHYLAVLDYLPAESRRAEVIKRLRRALRHRSRIATTHGVGPRYLHSTGQYHKGGPNTGLFLLITAADASGTPVPGTDYTFSTLKQAQALGDFDALVAAGREVIHYHLEDPSADFSAELEKVASGLR